MLTELVRKPLRAFPGPGKALKRLVRATYAWQHSFLWSRGELPFLLNSMQLVGEGAEIGVRQGTYSRYLLTHWRGEKLYSIDPWKQVEDYLTPNGGPVPQGEHDSVYADAVRALAPFGARSIILKEASPQAAAQFADGQLDFCFIDGRHDFESVRLDLEAWFPRVKPGGIFAGHDYCDGIDRGIIYGVERAVNEFCRMHQLKVVLAHEPHAPSWFIFK